jgi:methanogenic corrinoid protein MtbC1/DNA-binding XRE family transcriptional regulator
LNYLYNIWIMSVKLKAAAPKAAPKFSERRGSTILQNRERYIAAILEGNAEAASRAVNEALASGVTAKNVYLHILTPSQAKLGSLWVEGKITIAQEHMGTQITISEMGRLRPLLKPRPRLNKQIVIASPAGDMHSIGGRMIADFLHMDGWTVLFLGADTPPGEIFQVAREKKVDVVGLSLTVKAGLPAAKEVLRLLKTLPLPPRLLVGGQAAQTARSEVLALGADEVSTTAQDAIEIARKLVGLPPSASSLEQRLQHIGATIQKHRRAQRLSQQDIAHSAGLDRAYISAVEHGKHNVSVGAVMRIAEALDVSFEELILEE